MGEEAILLESVEDMEETTLESQNNIETIDIDFDLILKVGQEFECSEDALQFYNDYAKRVGFSTKINNNNKNSTAVVTWKSFSCSKEGTTNESYQKNKKDVVERSGERKRTDTRCLCKAKMNISRKKIGDGWVVTLFEDLHNHCLVTPRKVHLLRSHRKVSVTKKALIQEYSEANIPMHTQITLLQNDAGGPSAMGCLEKDIYNYETRLKAPIKGCDAETMIHHFDTEKERNDAYFYSYDTDSDGTLTRCFWADSDSRNSYAIFGDVVVFDTTYNTNKYGLYLCPFVGVNNHRQTIVFGCGFISDQSTDSFVWMFKKNLEAMPYNAQPKIILTDQEAAISQAIVEVFPGIIHHHCLWHILDKFPMKMNVAIHWNLHKELIRIIMDSESPQEFEARWTEKTSVPELEGNTWLPDIYKIRRQWVPAFVRQVFTTGMSSSQRVESNHSVLKKFLRKNCSLIEAVIRITRAIVHQRSREIEKCFHDLNETPRTRTTYEMEKQMVNTYTKTMFRIFQEEFTECARYTCHMVRNNDESMTYEVRRFGVEVNRERHRELTRNILTDRVSCSCRMFEFEGIPCRHILCWMRVEQVMLLPEQYILQRWTKNAKNNLLYEPATYTFAGKSFQSRRVSLKQLAMEVVDAASLTEARSTYLVTLLKSAKAIINGMDVEGTSLPQKGNSMSVAHVANIKDPLRTKAKNNGKRFKSAKERARSQRSRHCSGCGGTGHDLRTCQAIQRESLVDEPYRPDPPADYQFMEVEADRTYICDNEDDNLNGRTNN